MKKIGKIFLIIVIVGAVLYGAFMVFVNPGGFVDKSTLTNSYIDNLTKTGVCADHFNEETQAHCDSMTDLLKGHTVVVVSAIVSGENINLTITVDSAEMSFVVSFVEVEVTGLKSTFNKTYFLIDFMI